MPFKSKEQERYLQINEPEIYRDWVEKYGHFKGAEFKEVDDEIVHCSFCSEIIGTEQEVYDEETVEWYNADGETVCPPCYKEWMKEWERDTDMHYTPFYAESFGAEPDTVRFKVGERYTPRYYHGYGHSDIEIIRRTDKSVFVAQVDAQGNAAGNTLRYKIYTTPAVDIGGDRFPAQEYYKLTHGQPVRAGDTTKKAESFGAEDGYECSNCGSHELRYREYDNPEHNGFFCMNCGQSPCGINAIDNKPCTCDIMEYGQYTWLGEMPRTQFPSYIDVEAFKKQEQDKENERIRIVGSKKKLDAIRKAESFRSYKVAPDLSSYTKAELVSSIAGPQGTAAYDEVVYDPIAQSRLSAETATQRFKNYGNSLSGDTVCPACGDESWDEYLDGDEWRGICRCGYDFNTGSALENPLLTFYEMEALKEQGKLTSDQKEYLEWRITSTLSDLDSSSRNKKYIQDELVAHGWTLDRWGNAEPPEESASTLVGNAESINSFSPARLIILGASIGVALGLYNTRGE